jgi:alpha-N-acetylglucosamine transferase
MFIDADIFVFRNLDELFTEHADVELAFKFEIRSNHPCLEVAG